MIVFSCKTADGERDADSPPHFCLSDRCGFCFRGLCLMVRKVKKVKLVVAQTLFNWKDKYLHRNDSDDSASCIPDFANSGRKIFLQNFGAIHSGWSKKLDRVYLDRKFRRNCRSNVVIKDDTLWEDFLDKGTKVRFNFYVRILQLGVCTMTLSCYISSENGIKIENIILLSKRLQSERGRRDLKIKVRRKWKGPPIENIEEFFTRSRIEFCKSARISEAQLAYSDIYSTIHILSVLITDNDAQMIQGVIVGDTHYKNLAKIPLRKDFGKYKGDYVTVSPHKVVAFTKSPAKTFYKKNSYFIWNLFKAQERFQVDMLRIHVLKNVLQEETMKMRMGNHESKAFVRNMLKTTYYRSNIDRESNDFLDDVSNSLHGGLSRIQSILRKKSSYKKELKGLERLRSEYITEVNNWKPGLVKLAKLKGFL